MKPILLTLLAVIACAADIPDLKEIEVGASRNIEYRISRRPGQTDRIHLLLRNREERDIRLTYDIIAGAGDGLGDIRRISLIRRKGTWPFVGDGSIACAFIKPGIRVVEIEYGTIIEEEGYFYDKDGNESRSSVFKFIPERTGETGKP